MSSRLSAQQLTLSYPGASAPTLKEVSVQIRPGALTVIIGPNACGKSTLLRSFGRILRPESGEVFLDGKAIEEFASKAYARRVGLLPQSAVAPEGITVSDLVARGRYAHQGLLRQWSGADESAVLTALERTGTMALADRYVADLSGGQRQRVWIAMALAQQTEILLLDEPTTFLDLAHQLEILDLCRELTDQHGTTIVAVLHDLNQATRYADEMIAMNNGVVVAQGSPEQVVTQELVHQVFGVQSRIIQDPETGTPLVIPVASAPLTARGTTT